MPNCFIWRDSVTSLEKLEEYQTEAHGLDTWHLIFQSFLTFRLIS